MTNNTLQESNIFEKYFYLFIIIHIVVWTLVPAFIRLNLPLDAMEGTTWGHQLEWGYDKNPFVNGWLTALAIKLDGMSGWLTYFFSQISVGAAFYVVWKLGKKIFPPVYALFAVLLLESVQYFNLHAIDFNDNTLEIGFWALTVYYFYQALLLSNWRNWLLTGFFAGISMMTKYYSVMLFLPMLIFMLVNPDTRRHFKKAAFYGGLILFIAICLPHTLWLFSHDFVTIQYAIGRVSSEPTIWNHLYFPVQFAWQQIETFLPVVFLGLFIVGRRSPLSGSLLSGSPSSGSPSSDSLHKRHAASHLLPRGEKGPTKLDTEFTQQEWDNGPTKLSTEFSRQHRIKNFDFWFLVIVGLGPFVLTVLLSAVTGIKLRAAWGQPLLTFWSLLFIAAIRPFIVVKRIFIFFGITILVMGLMAGSYVAALIKAEEPSSANFPGKIIAEQLTKEWHQKYHTPLRYVAGSRWLAGNIAFYSPDHPAVYIDWKKQFSPWINESELKKEGALFVWDLSENNLAPVEEIKKRFPKMSNTQILNFNWLRNREMAPVKINLAYLPPNNGVIF